MILGIVIAISFIFLVIGIVMLIVGLLSEKEDRLNLIFAGGFITLISGLVWTLSGNEETKWEVESTIPKSVIDANYKTITVFHPTKHGGYNNWYLVEKNTGERLHITEGNYARIQGCDDYNIDIIKGKVLYYIVGSEYSRDLETIQYTTKCFPKE